MDSRIHQLSYADYDLILSRVSLPGFTNAFRPIICPESEQKNFLRTLLLSCFEEEKELLVEGGGHQRALRNLLLQLTRERRPGDDDFDSMCLERAEKLRERATESEAVVAVDLLDHFTASCSKPMRGEESPVKAAQALQFGAEVKVSEMSFTVFLPKGRLAVSCIRNVRFVEIPATAL